MSYYKAKDEALTSTANKIMEKLGSANQVYFDLNTGFASSVDSISVGRMNLVGLNLLRSFIEENEYKVTEFWKGTGDGSVSFGEESYVIYGSHATTSIVTDRPYDFTGYRKLRLKVNSVSGENINYVRKCRFVVDANPINNGNRGTYFINLNEVDTEYEMTLPDEKSSLYVGVMAWTFCDIDFYEITAIV